MIIKVHIKYGVKDFGNLKKNIHLSSLTCCYIFCLPKSIIQLLNTIIKCFKLSSTDCHSSNLCDPVNVRKNKGSNRKRLLFIHSQYS